jgi:hypothetical protein
MVVIYHRNTPLSKVRKGLDRYTLARSSRGGAGNTPCVRRCRARRGQRVYKGDGAGQAREDRGSWHAASSRRMGQPLSTSKPCRCRSAAPLCRCCPRVLRLLFSRRGIPELVVLELGPSSISSADQVPPPGLVNDDDAAALWWPATGKQQRKVSGIAGKQQRKGSSPLCFAHTLSRARRRTPLQFFLLLVPDQNRAKQSKFSNRIRFWPLSFSCGTEEACGGEYRGVHEDYLLPRGKGLLGESSWLSSAALDKTRERGRRP